MNGYEKAQQLGLTGTDAEIVAQLKAIPLHRNNVYITGGPMNTESVNLLHLLTARHRVMGMGTNQQWVGPLIELEGTDTQVAAIMTILRPLLQVNDTVVYCAQVEEAAGMLNGLTYIVGQLTGKAAQVEAEVKLLSGGRIGAEFSDLTELQYATQKAAAIEIAAKNTALELVTNTAAESAREEYRKPNSTPQTILAAAVAVLEAA
jgi:hypothetical protein